MAEVSEMNINELVHELVMRTEVLCARIERVRQNQQKDDWTEREQLEDRVVEVMRELRKRAMTAAIDVALAIGQASREETPTPTGDDADLETGGIALLKLPAEECEKWTARDTIYWNAQLQRASNVHAMGNPMVGSAQVDKPAGDSSGIVTVPISIHGPKTATLVGVAGMHTNPAFSESPREGEMPS